MARPLALMYHMAAHPRDCTPIPQERGVSEPSRILVRAPSTGGGVRQRQRQRQSKEGERGGRVHRAVKSCVLTQTIRALEWCFQW